MDRLLSPEDVAAMVPGLSVEKLKKLRFTGLGPRYLRPTPKTIVYEESAVIEWLRKSERLSTAAA